MAQNIVVANGVGTHASKSIETSKRPILIQFAKGGAAVIPKLIQAQVSVRYSSNGGSSFITEDVGKPIIQGRDWDSSESTPTFTFDVAPVLDAFIYKGISCFETMASVSSHTASISGYAKGLIVDYTVKAQEWSTVASVLTLNTDTAIETTTAKAFGGYLKDDVVITNKFSNCQASTNYLKNASWFINSTLIGSQPTKISLLTNCPESLKRNILFDSPLILSSLLQNPTVDLVVNYTNDSNTAVTNESIHDSYGSVSDLSFSNLSVNGTGLFSILSTATQGAIKNSNFSVNLRQSSANGKKLNFNIVERGSNSINSDFGVTDKDSTLLYFYNDFGVLDFYLFEGFSSVAHENNITSFKTSSKDYTSRSSNQSITSRASTTEIVTCSTIVNKETSKWLSEIFRSRAVFIYEDDDFVSVSVLDGDTLPLSSDRKPTLFEISFVKNTHHINY
tara:strand:+ start:2096 stop:3442 length:1347 start_codon:yes stop_codon:yes gene_type:complete